MTARCGSGDRLRSSGTAPPGALWEAPGCRWPPQTARTTVRTTTSAMEWFNNKLSKKSHMKKPLCCPLVWTVKWQFSKKVVKSNHTFLTLSPLDNRQEFVRIQSAKNDKFKHTRDWQSSCRVGCFLCSGHLRRTRYHPHLNLITLDKEFMCQVIKKATIWGTKKVCQYYWKCWSQGISGW